MLTQYKQLIKNKNFVLLWLSQIFSQLAIYMMNFLLLFHIFERTNSSLAVSFLWIAYALPALIIGPFASAVTDYYDKKKLLVYTNFLQFLILVFYALTQSVSIFLAYLVVVLYSFVNQFYGPSELSAVPYLVEKENLPDANSAFFITQQMSLALGLAIAGILLHSIGFQSTLLICAALLFSAFLSTSYLPNFEVKKEFTRDIVKLIIDFIKKIVEGYKVISKSRKIYSPLLLLLGIQAMLAVVTVNLPQIAKEIFDINFGLISFYIVIPAAIGAIFSAAITSRTLKMGIRKIQVIKKSLMALSLSFFVLIFLIPAVNNSLKVILDTLASFILGFSYVSILIPAQTFLQENTSEEFRGRIFGYLWYTNTLATILPVIFTGTITDIFGARILLFLVMGICVWFLVFMSRNKYWLTTDQR